MINGLLTVQWTFCKKLELDDAVLTSVEDELDNVLDELFELRLDIDEEDIHSIVHTASITFLLYKTIQKMVKILKTNSNYSNSWNWKNSTDYSTTNWEMKSY